MKRRWLRRVSIMVAVVLALASVSAARAEDPKEDAPVVSPDPPALYTYTVTRPVQTFETNLGAPIAGLFGADDNAVNVSLPFTFNFFGYDYGSVWVSSNGLLNPTARDTSYSNSISALTAKVAIAPLWDDWLARTAHTAWDEAYYRADADRAVFTWKPKHWYCAGIVEFQAVLYRDGRIQFNYGSSASGCSTATLGISTAEASSAYGVNVTSTNYIDSYLFTPNVARDTIPPTITIGGVGEGGVYTNAVAPTIQIVDLNSDGTPEGASGVDPARTSITLNGQAYTSGTPITQPGAYTLVVQATDRAGNSSSQTVHLQVKHATALTLVGDTAGDYHDPATLAAILTDVATGAPIANAPVTLNLGSQSCGAMTDAAGRAACVITPELPAGSYPLTASFAGNDLYLASSAASSFTVRREQTTLAITSSAALPTGGVVVRAVLTEDDGRTPVANRLVTFTAGGVTVSGTTDANGVVTATLPLAPGQYSLAAAFSGDAYYQPTAAASQTLYVYQATQFVIWGGNAPNLADAVKVGQSFVFWGSQWGKQVTGGDYAATAAFKGYVDRVNGASWSWDSGPGNSVRPPSTVPSYIGVLVVTRVAQTGSVVSGNVAELAVLKVDDPAALQPSPGHSATGVVVATIQ